jgi:hypothetical protein
LETTGLDSTKHDTIEIGALPVNQNSDTAKAFHALVKPHRRVTKERTLMVYTTAVIALGYAGRQRRNRRTFGSLNRILKQSFSSYKHWKY